MNKKLIIVLSLVGVIGATCIGLFSDFNVYKKNSKSITLDNSKLIMSITSFNGKSEKEPFLTCLGHTWISVNNTLDHSISINGYEVTEGETVTFSSWAITNHFGVVYNLEPEFIKQKGRYNGRQSISINIEESDLTKINNFIQNNDYWKGTRNCSYWSIHLWNSIVEDEYKMKTQTIVYTPTKTIRSFNEYTNVVENMDFSSASKPFMYQNGERMELDLCY